MARYALIPWIAGFLWCYTGVLTVAWFRTVAREQVRTHVGHFVSLMGVFVPVMSSAVALVLIGGFVGIPWVILILAVGVPGGLAVGLQLEISRIGGSELRVEMIRLGIAAALFALVASNTLAA
ncbi:MAG: hypothetical protein AAFR35_15480 [Pseudomonadota bacterium]